MQNNMTKSTDYAERVNLNLGCDISFMNFVLLARYFTSLCPTFRIPKSFQILLTSVVLVSQHP